MPSYSCCATFMVRSVVKPSLRTASCCSVLVVNGAAEVRCLRLRSTLTTRTVPPSASGASGLARLPSASTAVGAGASRSTPPAAWASCRTTSRLPARLLMANCSTFSPSSKVSRALNPWLALTPSRWTDQYSRLSKASISRSRSQIMRRAGLCTRPADRPRRAFHNSGEMLKPTR